MLVTGASSGIGRALAIRAARAGYGVYAVGRDRDALEALRVKIEAESGLVAVDATDIAVAANAAGLVARVLAHFGSIDVLVNNAGFVSAGPLSAQSDAELQRQFGTHVIGPVALVREARDALRAVRGHVFMLGSGVARVPVGNLGAYPPAKAAIRSATAILRRELASEGIAVTYVDPGAVDTPFMTRAGMPGAPAKILVSPEAVARKILIAVADRPRVLNVVAWQTAAVALAALFPRLTDLLLERAPALIGGTEPASGALDVSRSPAAGLADKAPVEALGPESRPVAARAGITASESAPETEPEATHATGTWPDSAPGNEPEATQASLTASDSVHETEPEATHAAITGPESAPETEPEATHATVTSPESAPGNEPEPTQASLPAPDSRSEAEPPAELPDRTFAPDADSFEVALAPHRRRMEKLHLRESFVRELLVIDAELEIGDIALRWAGMPNKNERAITQDVIEALVQAGFLEPSGDQTYRVVRTP